MRKRFFYAAVVILTSCAFLTGLTMPDAPRPQRHEKSQVQAAIEEKAASAKSRRQTQPGEKAKKAQTVVQDAKRNAQMLDETVVQPKHNPANRSARAVLPAKKLR